MKTILTLLSLVVIIAIAQAQPEKDIASAVEELKKAMIDADKAKLEALSDDNLSYGHSSGLIEDKATFVQNIASGNSDFVTITLSDQTIKVTGNTAVVRHKLEGDIVNKGTPGKVSLHVMTVWIKKKGGWKLLARQAVKI